MTHGNVELRVGGALNNGSLQTDGWCGQDTERVRQRRQTFTSGKALRGATVYLLSCLAY